MRSIDNIDSFVGQNVTVHLTGDSDWFNRTYGGENATFKLDKIDDRGVFLTPISGSNTRTLFVSWTALGVISLAASQGAQSRVA